MNKDGLYVRTDFPKESGQTNARNSENETESQPQPLPETTRPRKDGPGGE
ncbi:MAG: hypothetical protein PHN80_05550 [Hespellia sp.]|nr:hypothetical protein [Hespellia sp.]